MPHSSSTPTRTGIYFPPASECILYKEFVLRRILITILIIFIFVFSCPIYMTTYSYAESGATREEVVEAFKAYCKNRNLLIDGSVLGSAASWLGDSINSAIDTLGIDMDYIQSQISIDSSGLGTKYLLSASGVGIFNRIFAELLQRENLQVGDTDVNKIVKSGDWITDGHGNGCFIWKINNNSFGNPKYWGHNASEIVAHGSYMSFTADDFVNYINSGRNSISYPFNEDTVNIPLIAPYNYNGTTNYAPESFYPFRQFDTQTGEMLNCYGSTTVYQIVGGANNSTVFATYFGIVCTGFRQNLSDVGNKICYMNLYRVVSPDSDPADVTVTTPTDKPIKPQLPDDKPISIDPDGNIDHEPDTPDNPDNPDNPTEPWPPSSGTGGTPPDWDGGADIVPDGDGWNIPFNLPDLDIDWSIEGLQNKFPFSIPFDIYHLSSVLNATPQTPELSGTIDLKIYQWDVDMDLHDFDSVAAILRTMELIGFIIGLIMITRSIIKG